MTASTLNRMYRLIVRARRAKRGPADDPTIASTVEPTTSAPTTMRNWRKPGVNAASSSAFIADPPFEHAQLEQREHDRDREQRHREHGGPAVVVLGEHRPVDRVHEHVRSILGATLGKQIDLAERLERVNRSDDHREEDRGRQQRQRDAAETGPGAGAV